MRLRKCHAVVLCMFLLFVLGIAMAIQPAPLPDFELSTLDGQTVKSADLPSQGHWLLLYVQPNHQFSDRLLKLLRKQEYPHLATNAIVIVLGTTEDAKAMKLNYPELESAGWYADNSRSVFSQLHLHGIPVIVGMDKKVMRWDLNGVLPDGNTQKSILNTWLQN